MVCRDVVAFLALGGPRLRGRDRVLPVVIPPSYRFCVLCQSVREFRLDLLSGHSRCQVCDGGIAKAFYPRGGLRKVLYCFGCGEKTEHVQVPDQVGVVMRCPCGASRRK